MIYKKRQHKYSLRPRILGAIQKFQRPRKTLITARCQKKRSVPPRNNSTLRILRNAPLTDRARSAFSVSSACMHHAAARASFSESPRSFPFPRAFFPSNFHTCMQIQISPALFFRLSSTSANFSDSSTPALSFQLLVPN